MTSLTNSECRALAALERRGQATCIQLATDLAWSYAHTLASLEALAARGLVADEPLPEETIDYEALTPQGKPDLYTFRALGERMAKRKLSGAALTAHEKKTCAAPAPEKGHTRAATNHSKTKTLGAIPGTEEHLATLAEAFPFKEADGSVPEAFRPMLAITAHGVGRDVKL